MLRAATEHCRTGEDPQVSAALECSVAFHAILINTKIVEQVSLDDLFKIILARSITNCM